jgi:c-di-GMP-binding flagellar brake protein YcgR
VEVKLKTLNIRDKFLIRLSGGDGRELPVRLDEIVDDSIFYIDLPIAFKRPIKFKLGTQLDFMTLKEDGIHIFEGVVVEGKSSDTMRMRIKLLPNSYRKVQRRDYFRLEVSSNCRLKRFADFFSSSQKVDLGVIRNISAGGIQIAMLHNNFSIGEHIYITSELDIMEGGFWCEVMRVSEDDNRRSKYRKFLHLKFLFLTDSEVDEMVEVILKKQREHIKDKAR